jgi:hypothetical protein
MSRHFIYFVILAFSCGCNPQTDPPSPSQDSRLSLSILRVFEKPAGLPPSISASYELGTGHEPALLEDARPISNERVYNLLDQAKEHHLDVLITIEADLVPNSTIADLRRAWDFLEDCAKTKGFPANHMHVFLVVG